MVKNAWIVIKINNIRKKIETRSYLAEKNTEQNPPKKQLNRLELFSSWVVVESNDVLPPFVKYKGWENWMFSLLSLVLAQLQLSVCFWDNLQGG